MINQEDLRVASLGECRFTSPLDFSSPAQSEESYFRCDDDRVRMNVRFRSGAVDIESVSAEEAGPRKKVFFDPAQSTAAVVTCGGLSPGLNNVVRSIFHEASENYGVKRVLGIRNGYLGLNSQSALTPVEITREFVEPIDKIGGTVLGSSRGPQEPAVMADFLRSHNIDMLFCLGGDGTQRGAYALSEELLRRNAPISVIGIPKTIDNDVPFVRLSFGFTTALEKAAEVIRGAHVEARDAVNGISVVKLMGRHAGFIAAGASVVSQEVDFTLVPEVAFPLEGNGGLLDALERRMRNRGHAVIVVAEGAGQHLLQATEQHRDNSGNLLHEDIGNYLRQRIAGHFAERGVPVSIKYIDPSYHIRSVPANVYDRYLCDQMGRHAVHAAMAGKTGAMIGFEHSHYIHVPICAASKITKQMEVTGDLWRAVLEATSQPRW